MADIKAFLQPPVMNETKEVIISERFKDEDGNPVPFVVRVIDQETNAKLIRQAIKKSKINGRTVKELDETVYGNLLVVACTVEPNFKAAELCEYYKTVDPADVPGRMLSSGEYQKLVREINLLNDFVTEEKEQEELEEEAKN
ncbi:hypothetical protein AALB16_13845 [Lachnospiraceae bacterium 62-35]